MKRLDGSLVMRHEHSARAVVELRQIGKTPSSADPVFEHAPEAFNRIEVVTTVSWQEMQPKLLVPVSQRRRQLVRPVDATAVGDHDHLFPRMSKQRHHLMDILTEPCRVKLRDNLIDDARGAILHGPDDAEPHTARDPAPGAILSPCLAFEGFLAFDLTLAQWARREAGALHFAPPTCPGQGKTPEDRFIFIEQNDFTPASPVLEGREFQRRPRQLSGVRSEPSGGAAVADGFFLTRRGRSRG